MDQISSFSPNIHVKLLDGKVVRFARSSMTHWAELCEAIKADRIAPILAEIDAVPTTELKPVARAQARADVRDSVVQIGTAMYLASVHPKWITEHLLMAFVEAGGTREDAVVAIIGRVLPDGTKVPGLIPSRQQMDIASAAADLPVVTNAKAATEANPLIAGVDLSIRPVPNGSTGESSSSTSNDTAPGSTPAN